MGLFVNPDNNAFQMTLNSPIYVDKTKLIEYTNSVLNTDNAFICSSRPRRFGKSITANMLTAYYSKAASIAKTGDRPGVTRANQWVRITPYLELLDTPGLLWPKLSDQRDAQCLAFVGTINDQVMDQQMLAIRLLERLMQDKAQAVCARLRIRDASLTGVALLEEACRGRGWILPGALCDTDRGSAVILDEFRAGKLGRITLQAAPAGKPAPAKGTAAGGDKPEHGLDRQPEAVPADTDAERTE